VFRKSEFPEAVEEANHGNGRGFARKVPCLNAGRLFGHENSIVFTARFARGAEDAEIEKILF